MSNPRKRRLVVAREFDPSRWAHATFFVGFLLLAYVFANLAEDVWAILWSYWPRELGRPATNTATAIGLILALFGAILAWRNKRWFTFVSEVAVEVSQVTWPTKVETRVATIVVVVLTIICSVILAMMDLFWSNVTDWLYAL